MATTYPITISLDEDKLKYLYRILEKLRLDHNRKGADFRMGKITEKEFRIYQEGEFRQKKDKIFAEILPLKKRLGIFNLNPIVYPEHLSDPRLALKEAGKKETKWDGDINLKQI